MSDSFNDSEMNEYEKNQYEMIKSWKNQEPSIVSLALSYISKPISYVVEKIIPPSAISGALSGSAWLADLTIPDVVHNQDSISSLESCDLEADSVHNFAIAYASVEGGAAGAAGMFGMPADIPLIITLSLRTIRRIGMCYGFNDKNEIERDFVLSVLSAAGSNSMAEKNPSLS